MILLDAVYIHQSGGKVLLEYFIKTILEKGLLNEFYFLLDNRIEGNFTNQISEKRIFKINPSETERRKFYKEKIDDFTRVFCFANVPPPIKLKLQKVVILFHNALILDNKNMQYNLKTRFTFFLKKLYIKNHIHKNYQWIVQTKKMVELLTQKLTIPTNKIAVLPFYEENRFQKLNQKLPENNGEFLYVADGVKQKNHKILLDAWGILFDNYNLPITLHLTIPANFNLLLAEIKRLQNKGVSIVNHGNCNLDELKELYQNCNYFIMPSLTESFGLPLIEAAEAGCEIIAADLDYVYEIVKPMAVFNPFDKTDIAKIVSEVYLNKVNNRTEIVVENKMSELINLLTHA